MVPTFNPEFTFGSICIVISTLVSFLGIWFGMRNAIGNLTKGAEEMRENFKEMQVDLKVHITASIDQNMKTAGLLGDLKITEAITSTNVDNIKQSMKEFHDRLTSVSNRQNEFLADVLETRRVKNG